MEETNKIKTDLREISILIVEDGAEIIDIMDRTFKMIVKDIYLAKNGKEALEQYKRYQPDIVLTDLRMPLLNGANLIKTIREDDNQTPIIVISAYKNDLPQEEAKLVNAIFEKPIDFLELVHNIDACLQKK